MHILALIIDASISYEDQQRRLAEEIETLKERLQKYSEVHSLDARSNHEKVRL